MNQPACRLPRTILATVAAGLVLPVLAAAADPAPDPAALEFFEKKVRPVLVEHCYQCHSAEAKKPKGGLRVDSRAALLTGGDTGPALVPGNPDKSRLLEAVRYQDVELRMPPKGKLPDAAIADLAAWVKAGAAWPAENTAQTGKPKDEFDLARRKAEHWAWQRVRPQAPPAVKATAWPLDPVDRFLLSRLEAKGLQPAVPADARTLLRRVYFDLTGLPPTPAEIDAFFKDSAVRSPYSALETVVDRLLASPRFGERWARHWLDLVRYAESRGHEFDYRVPNAYQYRDYVISAFNADVPYNQFVVEHVAGDLLDTPRLHPTERFNESILGTGFWFLGEEVHSPVDIRQDQADRFDNRLDVLTKTFLGLTVSCARCHDHKFDAISTKDYYALFGFLESSSYRLARFDTMVEEKRLAGKLHALREKHRPTLQRATAEALRPTVARLGDYLTAAAATLAAGGPSVAQAAEQHQLDADLLAHWARHLAAAAKDETDLLHPLAQVALTKKPADVLAALAERWQRQRLDAAAALERADIIVDYAEPPQHYLVEGVAFGDGPVQPGDVQIGREAGQPILRVFDRGAAVKDPAWDRLKLKPGSEKDPGPVGAVDRAGRSLRTPTFTASQSKVWSLVRGTGRAYAAVGQHVVINGPLHGSLLRPIKTDGRFQWILHDLGRYQGVPAFIEYTPADGADLAVALVVQADAEPGPAAAYNASVLDLLGTSAKVADLATAYRGLFLGAVELLAADRLTTGTDAGVQGALVDWLLQRPELIESTARQGLTAAAEPFMAEQARLLATLPAESRLALAMMDGTALDTPVFVRGSPKTPGPVVPRRFLEALNGSAVNAFGSGREVLARQLTDPERNPFIARVLVNRVWHHLFGRGIVASVDNFGVLGERPTHPELLDYLADRFVKEGWSLKKLIRALVLSRAYQMASTPVAMADAADPGNLLLHRQRIRRLEGEAIRDALLAISGRLDEKMYGPSVPVHLTEFQEGRGRPAPGPLDGAGRRSIYLSVRRNFLSSFLLAFDTPIPFSTVGRRTVSNVPAQALILMNDPFVHQQAGLWAKRVLADGGTVEQRIDRMYQSAFGRLPTDTERSACRAFLATGGRQPPSPDEPAAWTDLAHALINVKEFIFIN